MKKTCSKCKYWRREYGSTPTGIPVTSLFGDCDCTKFVYSGTSDLEATDSLIYWDYESYKAGFVTGKDFGCIHFSKEEKK
jgi:hypothetical protein